jgi:streptomycin 6-kinase
VPRWLAQARPRGGVAAELLDMARRLHDPAGGRRSTLVHGDFHHHNILERLGGYAAIDPKPMLGEPEFDIAPFLWNPLPRGMDEEVAERRLAAFAAAGLDQGRMRRWAAIRGAYLGANDRDAAVLLTLLRRYERLP